MKLTFGESCSVRSPAFSYPISVVKVFGDNADFSRYVEKLRKT
ncbi:hypothetical protein [Nostoc sp.]